MEPGPPASVTADDVARFWEATGADPETHNAWLDGMRTAPVVIVPLAHKDAYLERYASAAGLEGLSATAG